MGCCTNSSTPGSTEGAQACGQATSPMQWQHLWLPQGVLRAVLMEPHPVEGS